MHPSARDGDEHVNDLHRCADARRAAGLCLRACILCVQLWLAAGPGPGLLGVTKD